MLDILGGAFAFMLLGACTWHYIILHPGPHPIGAVLVTIFIFCPSICLGAWLAAFVMSER